MTKEILQILMYHCNCNDIEKLKEAYESADGCGYVDNDGYSNNPVELIAYINGYLNAMSN